MRKCPTPLGACGRDCEATKVKAIGHSTLVDVQPMKHGGYQKVQCPKGFTGPLRLHCFDGAVQYTNDICGQNCVSGSLTIGTSEIFHPQLDHSQIHNLPCTFPYSGWSGTLSCFWVSILP